MKVWTTVATTLLALLLAGLLFIYSGWYDIGADAPHWSITHQLIAIFRDRSIKERSTGLQIPDLKDPTRVLKGAGQYAAMCTGCHLAPGTEQSEIRTGLYPVPPNLTRVRVAPEVAFWAIKHGIKMSAMPAWGSTHDDATIWSMVSFLQTLPTLSAEQYRKIVADAPPDEDMDMKMNDKSPTGHPDH